MEKDGSRLYAYNMIERFSSCVINIIGTMVTFFVTTLSIIGLTSDMVRSIVQGETPDIFHFCFAILISLLLPCLPLMFANLYPSILITDRGLKIQVFFFWWMFVPWRDVKDVRSTILPASGSRLVIVNHLTVVHRLIGWVFGYTFEPAFLIKRTLGGYEDVIRTIEQRIEIF